MYVFYYTKPLYCFPFLIDFFYLYIKFFSLQNFKLTIENTQGKGRGVFAGEPIAAGATIEICPVLVLSFDDTRLIDTTFLGNYNFQWNEYRTQSALALGYGSIYNHSFLPNARYDMYFEEETLHIVALRAILEGEEICFNYNGDEQDRKAVWFTVAEK